MHICSESVACPYLLDLTFVQRKTREINNSPQGYFIFLLLFLYLCQSYLADPARMSISPTKKYCANIELPDKEKDLGVDPDADADHFDMG